MPHMPLVLSPWEVDVSVLTGEETETQVVICPTSIVSCYSCCIDLKHWLPFPNSLLLLNRPREGNPPCLLACGGCLSPIPACEFLQVKARRARNKESHLNLQLLMSWAKFSAVWVSLSSPTNANDGRECGLQTSAVAFFPKAVFWKIHL